MKDILSSKKSDDGWREKYFTSQTELRDKEKEWQEIELLCRLLISRLAQLVDCEDAGLINNLQRLRKSLREGESLLQLEKLIKDIADQILALETTTQASNPVEDGKGKIYNNEQVKLLGDILYVLLDRINFPSQFASDVNKIKLVISRQGPSDNYHRVLAGITALAELLTEIFNIVRHDKKKIEYYLHHISTELQHLDKGINISGMLHHEKKQAGDNIKTIVESEVLEMENTMTTLVDIGEFKITVQKSMDAIRSHLESFKQQEQQRNQQADTLVCQLGQKLKVMEQECEDLKQQVLEKHQQILSDALTGLRNRLAYEEAIEHELERFQRYRRPVTLLILDLDNFKYVNDTYGHTVGDKVLQFVARILTKNVRSVDFLARYGGEEFVVILPELELIEAKKATQKICKTVQASKLDIDGNVIRLTISGGIAQIRQQDTAESLFERADAALYLAKERGRNRCETE